MCFMFMSINSNLKKIVRDGQWTLFSCHLNATNKGCGLGPSPLWWGKNQSWCMRWGGANFIYVGSPHKASQILEQNSCREARLFPSLVLPVVKGSSSCGYSPAPGWVVVLPGEWVVLMQLQVTGRTALFVFMHWTIVFLNRSTLHIVSIFVAHKMLHCHLQVKIHIYKVKWGFCDYWS